MKFRVGYCQWLEGSLFQCHFFGVLSVENRELLALCPMLLEIHVEISVLSLSLSIYLYITEEARAGVLGNRVTSDRGPGSFWGLFRWSFFDLFFRSLFGVHFGVKWSPERVPNRSKRSSESLSEKRYRKELPWGSLNVAKV